MHTLLASASHLFRRSRWALLAVAFSGIIPAFLPAQDQPSGKQEKFYLSDKISEELGKIKPLADAKKWDEAVALIDGLLKTATPNSFDEVQLCNYKVQFLLNKGDYARVLEPLETSLRVSAQFHYLAPGLESELTFMLAQIYFQEAQAKGRAVEQQKQYFAKAAQTMERWLKIVPKATVDGRVFYASILYYMAQVNPDAVDKDLLKKAQIEAENTLLMSTRPREQHYQLLLAILTQENEYERASDYLELLVKQYPNKKEYWQQLAALYNSLAADKDQQKAYENNIRFILTMERAQALGILNTPKDNFNVVGIYINIGQYERAAQMLEDGLKSGKIDDEQKNWEYLAMCYQQLNKELKSIEVLKQASTHFPKSGQLYFLIAQYYAQIDKALEAYNAGMKAMEIGNIDKPGMVYSYLAYWAFDARKFDEALVAVNKAYEYPETKKDTNLPKVKAAIEAAIREREFIKGNLDGKSASEQPASGDAKQPTQTPSTKNF